MAEHTGGIVNSPPRLLVEAVQVRQDSAIRQYRRMTDRPLRDNGASHPLRESGAGLRMVSPLAEHVPSAYLSAHILLVCTAYATYKTWKLPELVGCDEIAPTQVTPFSFLAN